MLYLEVFLFTNIFVLFELTIYIVFFYFKYYYTNYKRNLYEELFLILNIFLLIFLYLKLNIDFYIFFLTINILLLLQFNKLYLAIFTILWYSVLSNVYFIILYIFYLLVYLFYKKTNKSKFFLTYSFSIITTIFMIIYIYINNIFIFKNILLIILYIMTIYIITLYIIYLKKRIKLYLTIKDIEKDKAFKTSIFKVTHEIKNPLAVIKGYLSIFDPHDSNKCKRYKNILECEVNNALLVLKDFSELNNMKIIKEHMNFNKLLIEIKETIVPFFKIKRINLKIDSEKQIYINADYNRLKQVFINILKNSCEALDNKGTINIKAYKSNSKLIINIKDNGHGMTKETIENLFTPFYSKKSNGTGLGLCLSKEIIDSHGGSIKYSSVLDKYTLVKITLPIN